MALNPTPKPPRGFDCDRSGAAEILGCRPATLADQASKGEGPPFCVVGGRAWYRLADLERELERRTRRPVNLPRTAA
jgi:hypothetical protein